MRESFFIFPRTVSQKRFLSHLHYTDIKSQKRKQSTELSCLTQFQNSKVSKWLSSWSGTGFYWSIMVYWWLLWGYYACLYFSCNQDDVLLFEHCAAYCEPLLNLPNFDFFWPDFCITLSLTNFYSCFQELHLLANFKATPKSICF